MSDKLRVAVVGCGQIADAHVREIRKIRTAKVVAVCDRVRDLAERASHVFEIPAFYAELRDMFDDQAIDVVHVTTPAASHKHVALECIRAGAHVYVEKPFAINARDASEVLATAKDAGKRVCVGHNELFDTVWLETRKILHEGLLGDIVHLESLQGYDLSGPFGALIRSDPGHWVRGLPGGLFHNTISHPVYKITDCLPDWLPNVSARWGYREELNLPIPVELRVSLWAPDATANLWVSSVARPVQRIVRIYGTRGSLEVDLQAQSLVPMQAATMRGPFVPMEYAWRRASQGSRDLIKFLGRFMRNRIHFFQGLNGLITAFYESIQLDRESPTPPAEILRVTSIMDQIFESCSAGDPRQ